NSPKQGMSLLLNNLHVVTLGVEAGHFHSLFYQFVAQVIIHLITMPVAFLKKLLSVGGMSPGTFRYFAVIQPQSHCASFGFNIFLVRHQAYNRIFGLFIKFSAVGFRPATFIASKFNNRTLHAQANTEKGNTFFSAVSDSRKLAANAAPAKSGCH